MTPTIPVNKLEKVARHGIDLRESMLPPGAKLKFKFQNAPISEDEFPKVKYHPTKGRVVVQSAADEAERTPEEQGWVNTPADFPESAVKEPTTPGKLDLLEQLGVLIASESAIGEGLTDTLCRIIQERNDFAVIAAKLTGADPRKKGK